MAGDNDLGIIALLEGDDDVARARFAHALGRDLKRWNASDARRWAAELSRLARSRDDAESPFFTALQLVARGFADSLEDARKQANEIDFCGFCGANHTTTEHDEAEWDERDE